MIEWYWLAYLACLLFLLPQIFPTGRPLPGRFTWVWRATVVWAGSFVVLGALESEIELPGSDKPLRNPIGIPGLRDVEEGAIGVVLFAGALILVASSLFWLAGPSRTPYSPWVSLVVTSWPYFLSSRCCRLAMTPH